MAITDQSGNVAEQRSYAPYGKEAASAKATASQSNPTERGYTGQIKDQTTGLNYYNARYYDPVLSRFISADTVGDLQNPYSYVGGNPINASDPSGNIMTVEDGGGGGGRRSNSNNNTPNFNTDDTSIYTWQEDPAIWGDILTDVDKSTFPELGGVDTRRQAAHIFAGVGGALSAGACGFGFFPGCYAANILLGATAANAFLTGDLSSGTTFAATADFGPFNAAAAGVGVGQLGAGAVQVGQLAGIGTDRLNFTANKGEYASNIDDLRVEGRNYYPRLAIQIANKVKVSGVDLTNPDAVAAQVSREVNSTIIYRNQFLHATMETACRFGSGVCYHKANLAAAVLERLGIPSGVQSINGTAGGHRFTFFAGSQPMFKNYIDPTIPKFAGNVYHDMLGYMKLVFSNPQVGDNYSRFAESLSQNP